MSHSGRSNKPIPQVTFSPTTGPSRGTHVGPSFGRPRTAGCNAHRPPGSLNSATALPSLSAGTELRASDLTSVRARIAREIRRWNQHYGYSALTSTGPSASSGSEISNATLGDLATTVHRVFGIKPSRATSQDVTRPQANLNQLDGAEITISEYNRLVSEYNAIRSNCICNTDCACNAVCACNNDCGCNYSDKRLKRLIKYF